MFAYRTKHELCICWTFSVNNIGLGFEQFRSFSFSRSLCLFPFRSSPLPSPLRSSCALLRSTLDNPSFICGQIYVLTRCIYIPHSNSIGNDAEWAGQGKLHDNCNSDVGFTFWWALLSIEMQIKNDCNNSDNFIYINFSGLIVVVVLPHAPNNNIF